MSPEGGTSSFGPGAVLGGRYRLERAIATGGMATVWLARDTQLDRDVAVKILSDVLAENPAYTERFRREARVAARLSHPSLVRMFDYAGETERPYIVMEYIGGGTLADRIAAGTADELDPDSLARQLLDALGAIHAAGVVHRDVKPSNVLLDGAERAHLTDFGIAQPEDATQLTGTGEVVGTLKYMAPEVLEGKPATERSDLYALGVVLTECLAGRAVPPLEALVDRLTAGEPQDRPASAAQARGLLESYEQRATTATVPLGTVSDSEGSKVIELNGKRVLAAVAVLALAGVLIAVALGGGGSNRRPATNAGAKAAKPQSTTTSTATSTSTTASTTAEPTTPTESAPPAEETKPPKDEKPPKEKAKDEEKVPPGQAKKED